MSKRTFPLIAVLALSTAFAVTFVSALSRSAKTPASANGISNYWQRRQAARFAVGRVGSDKHSADYAARHPGLSLGEVGRSTASLRNAVGISRIMIGVNSGADECRMLLPGRYGAGPPYKTPAC